MKIKVYVILNYGHFYAVAEDKESAINMITGTSASKTKLEIVHGTLEYQSNEVEGKP